ncbi:Ger(x)C family spore germination protein [Bacillus sp. FJAT-50079]|uniref:Ger(x)C family spore germination protein n=1 Tax=Bacillus sp. FJAT-50079 TaxID=2833577 RepID=UPI001BCA4456|nr:Ger(x)C family spore germination protein [Bacillus sp. FJAT-50079]MBS4210242.1 Ger(x)C family spore germination protein [Bacillus sp. FJAT-50079]
MKKRTIIFVVIHLLVFTFLQTGCAFKDIDKRLFVMAIGIDYTENEQNPYQITLKLALPSGQIREAAKAKYTYLTKESDTLAGAIRIIKTHVDKEIDFGHTRVIVFGEEVLKRDLKDVMDFFLRRSDIQVISWVAVGKPTAEKVLRTEPPSEMAASNALFNFFAQNGVESSYIVTTYLFDFRRRVLENGIDLILPILQVNGKSTISINKSLILKEENKVLELTSAQTKRYNVLANRGEEFDLEVKKKGLTFLMKVDKVKTNYKILTPANERPILKMNVKIFGIIEESNQPLSPEKLDEYSKIAGERAKKNLQELLLLFQENNVDPLGFGLRYKATRIHNTDTFAEWQRIYPNIKFDLSIEATIKSTGTIK